MTLPPPIITVYAYSYTKLNELMLFLSTEYQLLEYYNTTYCDKKKVYQHKDKFDRDFTNNILSILQFVLVELMNRTKIIVEKMPSTFDFIGN